MEPLLERGERVAGKENEHDLFQQRRGSAFYERNTLGDHHIGGDINRKTTNTGSQSGKRDAGDSQFARTNERISSRSTDFGTIRCEILAHDRGVNDVLSGKRASTGHDSFTNRNRTFSYCLALDFASANAP